jgi:hypothetical protein
VPDCHFADGEFDQEPGDGTEDASIGISAAAATDALPKVLLLQTISALPRPDR